MKSIDSEKILLVPTWLTGTWKRSYIRRAVQVDPDPVTGTGTGTGTKTLGDPDSTVEVRYIQTPWAFVDVRRPKPIVAAAGVVENEMKGSKEVAMAFAGVTTVVHDDDDNDDDEDDHNHKKMPPLVNWHTCLEMDASPDTMDCMALWEEADTGKPRPTPDQGYFLNVSKDVGIPHAYRENDPDGTLEELWIRVDDDDDDNDDGNNKQFLAARKERSLLVVAGRNFGYADQDKNMFVSGRISSSSEGQGGELIIDMSASDTSLEGSTLSLEQTGWTILPGSTLDISKVIL